MPYVEPKKVKEGWEKGAKATRKAVRDYQMNSLFLADEQWVAPNKVTGGIDEIPRLDIERVQLTVNVLRPRTRGILARATGRPLMFQVPPRAADDEAVQGAQTALEVVNHYYDCQDWEQLREDQAHTTWIGGTAGLVLDWDPSRGRALREPDTGRPISTSDGRRPMHEGDLHASIASIAEMTFPAGTRNGETALRWWKLTLLPPEEAKERFGLSQTPKPDAGALVSPSAWHMLSSREQGSIDSQLCAVLTQYERPNDDSDRGQIVVVVGNDRVAEAEWPFPFIDRLNIVITRETFVHGRWYGDTILTSARIPQMAINQAHSSIAEHMKRAANAVTWINQATADFVEDWTDEPGEYRTYVGPEKPFQTGATQMPSWWIQQPERMTGVVDDQLGSVEVMRGVAPRNVESGFGLSVLSENANTPLGQMAKETARSWGRFTTMALQTLEHHVTEPRTGYFEEMPEYALPAREFEWTGKDFAGQTKVVVPIDSISPRSPAQVQAWAQAQFDRGAIDLRQYARLVQLPEQEHMLEIADPDSAKAQYENYRLAQGFAELPDPIDDDHKHIATISAHMKSRRFSSYPKEIQQLFRDHLDAHEQQSLDKASKMAGRVAADPAAGLAATGWNAPGVENTPTPGQIAAPDTGAGTPPAQPGVAPAEMGEPTLA